MTIETTILLATFTSPENITMTPASMLWMFPLLLSIAIIYKATKVRVIFWAAFLKSVLILFLTLSAFMITAAVLLNLAVWLLAG